MSELIGALVAASALLSFFSSSVELHGVLNYIDLGSGSLIIQILIAGMVGAVFMIKVYWGKLRLFFRKLFSKSREGDD